MPRRLKIKTSELGDLELYLIYQYGERWEDTWAPAQEVPAMSLLTKVQKAVMDHALLGWSSPLVKALGIPPDGALRKLPVDNRVCERRDPCPFYRPKECVPTATKMPWCFEPSGIEDPNARRLVAELVQFWRQGVYTVVVIDAEQ